MLHLLIVEDQSAVREVVAEIAGELGEDVVVTQVGSLEEAREALQSRQWNGLITDMSLGDGNALEMIDELRQSGKALPPTILMSGFLTSARMSQALKLGIEHVLAKPFAPDVLLECLQKLLHQGGEGEEESPNPKRVSRSSDRLLPEMFEMDRRLGLIFRIFNEIPAHQNVASVCSSALNLASEVVHGQGGYLAFFERRFNRLVVVASQGMDDSLESSCELSDTPFSSLILGDDQLIQSATETEVVSCWPGLEGVHHVAIPVRLQGVAMGVLCLLSPASDEPLKAEARHTLGLLVKELDTQLDNRAVHAALADNMKETLIALVRSLEARDRYTRDHSARVGSLAAVLAADLGLDQDQISLIRIGGLLHDIGKCGIPDEVLLKPGRYTDQEFAIMKAHPAIGDKILKNMDTMVRERLMIRHHHERFDGLGYPDRLAGEHIPLEARIVCVADAIDAMTTHRVYRMVRPLSFCAEQLKNGSGTQFDPQVVEVALAAIERGAVSTQAEKHAKMDGVLPLSALISVKTEVRTYG